MAVIRGAKLLLGGGEIQVTDEDVNHTFSVGMQKGGLCGRLLRSCELERANVFRLPAFGSLGYVELHCLTLLQASEATCLDRRKMHENVFARLAADEAVAFGVVEPLYCSLFHMLVLFCSFFVVTLEGFGRNLVQVTSC